MKTKSAVHLLITVAVGIAFGDSRPLQGQSAKFQKSKLTGSFYSATQNYPPFPFNPFPDLPVFALGDGRYIYDDSTVDYVRLRKEAAELAALSPMTESEVMSTLAVECTTNSPVPQFSAIRKQTGEPVVMRWCSDQRGVYSVLYRDDLNGNPSTNWQVAVEGLPSQGFSTVWADTGTEYPPPGRLSSSEAQVSNRFFRVVMTDMTSNTIPTVTITSPTASQVLSEVAQVQGSASAPQGISESKLYVDGVEVVGGGGGGTFTLSFDTRFFPNGPHRLSVVSTDAGGWESTETNELAGFSAPTYGVTNVEVVFSNALSNVRLRYNGFRPEQGQVQLISGTWTSARNWRVDITQGDNESVVYRTFTGSGTQVSVLWDGRDGSGNFLSPQAIAYHVHDMSQLGFIPGIPGIPPMVRPYGRVGTVGIMGQGHHPSTGNYPHPDGIALIGGPVPHGSLKSPRKIANDLGLRFKVVGLDVLFSLLDDDCRPSAIKATYAGGSNWFNGVNLGLYVGHGLSGQDPDYFNVVHLNYLPLYNSQNNTMTYVRDSALEIDWGSSQLKWMCLYSCNQLRDERYRPPADYDLVKQNGLLPMNTDLHILQGYATEMTVTSAMPGHWVPALTGGNGTQNKRIIEAWNFVCRRTQPRNQPDINIARSVYWPECRDDYLYGYGSQTNPDRDPWDPSEYLDLLERDERADAPEP